MLPPPSTRSINVRLIRALEPQLVLYPVGEKGKRRLYSSCMWVFVTTWMFSSQIRTCMLSKALPQMKKMREKKENEDKTLELHFYFCPSLPLPPFWFNFRHGEALPGSCGQKWSRSRLLTETMKSQCHSCPTLHLVWGRGAVIRTLLIGPIRTLSTVKRSSHLSGVLLKDSISHTQFCSNECFFYANGWLYMYNSCTYFTLCQC